CADSGARLRRRYVARMDESGLAEAEGAGDAEEAGARPRGRTAVSSGDARSEATGVAAKDAQAAARQRFGNVALVKEDCRENWTFTWMETVWQDIRYAARTLAKSPGFVAVVVFSLMLGIGANVSVFSVMNTVMLRALPYPQPEQLMAICPTSKEDPKYDDMP